MTIGIHLRANARS